MSTEPRSPARRLCSLRRSWAFEDASVAVYRGACVGVDGDRAEVPEQGQRTDRNCGGDVGAHHLPTREGAGEAEREWNIRAGLFLGERRGGCRVRSGRVRCLHGGAHGIAGQIAGTYMHEAWDATPLDNDAGMNITGIDYKELRTPQDDYLEAIKQDMTFWRVAIPKLRK